MKTLQKTLTKLLCIILLTSSCDLLYEEEEEEKDYVDVIVNVTVYVGHGSDAAKGEAVKVKIYKEGQSGTETLITDDRGFVYYKIPSMRMRAGEIITASAYLKDNASVYKTTSLSFEFAYEYGKAYDYEYSWQPILRLTD
jgi:hypothetical protein